MGESRSGSSTREREAVRAWLRVFLGATCGTLALVAAVNYFVNPLGYYPTRFLPPLAWSSRREKVTLLRARPATEVLVVGSSRSMKLAPRDIEALVGRPTFNAAVDSASVEDWDAIVRYAVERCHAPLNEIVLGIDVEALRNDLEPDPRLSATRELRPLLAWSYSLDYYITASKALVEFEQLDQSARSVRFHLTRYPPVWSRFDADGFLHYVVWEARVAAGTFVPEYDASMREYDSRFSGFTHLDERRCEAFRSLLSYARARRIAVRAFITPLSPRLLAHLRETANFDRLHEIVVDYVRGLSAQFSNFSVVDMTEVASWGGDPEGFFDGAHADDANARRLVNALLTQGPAAERAP